MRKRIFLLFALMLTFSVSIIAQVTTASLAGKDNDGFFSEVVLYLRKVLRSL